MKLLRVAFVQSLLQLESGRLLVLFGGPSVFVVLLRAPTTTQKDPKS